VYVGTGGAISWQVQGGDRIVVCRPGELDIGAIAYNLISEDGNTWHPARRKLLVPFKALAKLHRLGKWRTWPALRFGSCRGRRTEPRGDGPARSNARGRTRCRRRGRNGVGTGGIRRADGKGRGSPHLTLDGFSGPLETLLTLARAQRIDLFRISLTALLDQLIAALQQASKRVPLGQQGDWMVMAAWLVQLRARLLLPADAPAQQEAAAEADAFRGRLVALDYIQAFAQWLERRPQLGHDVLVRGKFRALLRRKCPDLVVPGLAWLLNRIRKIGTSPRGPGGGPAG
jgi:Segregation and condensation protein ScpA